MNDKYCPAGKIECLHFNQPHHCSLPDPHFGETNLKQIEVCPWPSRQEPIEKIRIKDKPEYATGYYRGATEQLKRCNEAIKKIKGIEYILGYETKTWIDKDDATAAIRSAAIKETDHDTK